MAASNQNGLLPLETPDSPGLNLYEDAGPRVLAVGVVLMILSTTAVILRFMARYVSKVGFWYDDWMILFSMFMAWGCNIIIIYATSHGFGKHIAIQGDLFTRIGIVENFFRTFYIYETFYTFAVASAKLSILLFYSRIFKERPFRIVLYTVSGLVVSWFIAVQIVVFAQCIPVQSFWDITVPGHCVDLVRFILGAGIPNIIFNAIILIMPLPMIWTLDIQLKHKLALCSVFLLGGFVVVVSIIRAVYLSQIEQVDITYEFINAGIWTSVEPSIAVVSACLPILRALWVWRRPQHSVERSVHVSRSDHRPTPKIIEKSRNGSFTSNHPLNELPADRDMPWTKHAPAMPQKKSPQDSSEEDIPMQDLPMQGVDMSHKRQSSQSTKTGVPPIAELYA